MRLVNKLISLSIVAVFAFLVSDFESIAAPCYRNPLVIDNSRLMRNSVAYKLDTEHPSAFLTQSIDDAKEPGIFGNAIHRVYRTALAEIGQLLLERGFNRGIELLREAAELGHAGAQALLAMLSYDESRRIYDPKAAAAWAEKSAAQGDANGQFILGVILYDRAVAMKSEAITPTEERGVASLQAAASQGHTQANWLLGSIYEIRGAYAKARYHHRQAVNAGFLPAKISLATLLMEGLGGLVDEAEAIRLYCAAGDYGVERAAFDYGLELDC